LNGKARIVRLGPLTTSHFTGILSKNYQRCGGGKFLADDHPARPSNQMEMAGERAKGSFEITTTQRAGWQLQARVFIKRKNNDCHPKKKNQGNQQIQIKHFAPPVVGFFVRKKRLPKTVFV
jgi:hypothetical protein